MFYVYEHWRPDIDRPFYVGKGKAARAYKFKRNRYYDRVVTNLSALGMCVEVRMVASGLDEADAFTIEKQRIIFWRENGVNLANLTDGGEGVSNPSPETRIKIGRGRRGKPFSLEHRSKLSRAQKRRFLDPKEREKCVTPIEIRKNNPLLKKGRLVSLETRMAQSRARSGKKDSEKTRIAKSEALKKRHALNPMTEETKSKIRAQRGWKHTPEARAKMRGPRKTANPMLNSVDYEVEA